MGSGSSRRRGAAAPAVAENRELLAAAPAEDEEVAALPGPGHRAPAPVGVPLSRDTGRSGRAAGTGGGAGAPPEQPALSAGSPPGLEDTTTDHQCPQSHSKKPAGQSTISYDYSEEELMASIEREYCR